MFQWIRRTYFTLTGNYADFSFWVLRRRHNIMPIRFLTLLRWSWMHHDLSIALKEHIFPEWKRKPVSYKNCLQIRWINGFEWFGFAMEIGTKHASVVTDRLHTGGDHIFVAQRNWSNFSQQSNCCSVDSTPNNSVPIQRLNIKSKTLLIKKLQLTNEKENKPGRNR